MSPEPLLFGGSSFTGGAIASPLIGFNVRTMPSLATAKIAFGPRPRPGCGAAVGEGGTAAAAAGATGATAGGGTPRPAGPRPRPPPAVSDVGCGAPLPG